MKIRIISLIIIFVIFAGLIIFFHAKKSAPNQYQPVAQPANNQNLNPAETSLPADTANIENNSAPASASITGNFLAPLDRAVERVTKKPFGIFITPQNSPVQPERFRGYHTGTDFETFSEEQNIDVPVKAVCDGKMLAARTASGYGGVAVLSCLLNSEPITVVYGHLNISSVKFRVGDQIKAGDVLASLGAAYSSQTDGERKHLHLGFHKGTAVSILGYVQNKNDLSGWIDPCSAGSVCG